MAMACSFPSHRHYDGHPDGLDDPCPCCSARQWEGIADLSIHRFLDSRDPEALSDAAAFFQQVNPSLSPPHCWHWGGIHKARFRRRWYTPQHLAYLLCWGDPGPAAITVLCGNSECVNPFHLHTPALMHPTRRPDPAFSEQLSALLAAHTLSPARSS